MLTAMGNVSDADKVDTVRNSAEAQVLRGISHASDRSYVIGYSITKRTAITRDKLLLQRLDWVTQVANL